MGLTPANIRHSPADKRGLGLTFLGMMAREESANNSISKNEYDETISGLIQRIEALEKQLSSTKTSWYRRLWEWIKS